jgi:ribosomal protein S18 acetylase RimI-like enzyme
MHITPLTPQTINATALNQVAALIYHTDTSLFGLLFGAPNRAIPHITQLVAGTQNSFSYQYIHTAIIDNTIAGIIIILPPKPIREDDFVAMLPWTALLRLALMRIVLAPLLHTSEPNTPYIQNISVDQRFQGKGIGQQLIAYASHNAHAVGYHTIALDVSLSNPRAQHLYQRLGFVVTKTTRLWPSSIGVHRMHKALA